MTEENAIQKADVKPVLRANGRGLVFSTIDEMYRFAQCVAKSGIAPESFRTPEQVIIAIQSGAELGMTPMRSLNSFYVIKGKASLYGDTPLALVRESELMEWIAETFEGEDADLQAVCRVKRKGDPEPTERRFGVQDAIQGGLWGKAGTWKQYPKRMLQMRARSWALRDVFPDCFGGTTIAEEYVGIEVPTPQQPKSAGLLDEGPQEAPPDVQGVINDPSEPEPPQEPDKKPGAKSEALLAPPTEPVDAPFGYLCDKCFKGFDVAKKSACPHCGSKKYSVAAF